VDFPTSLLGKYFKQNFFKTYYKGSDGDTKLRIAC